MSKCKCPEAIRGYEIVPISQMPPKNTQKSAAYRAVLDLVGAKPDMCVRIKCAGGYERALRDRVHSYAERVGISVTTSTRQGVIWVARNDARQEEKMKA